MDSQDNLFRFLDQQEHGSIYGSSVSPLVGGAKQCKNCQNSFIGNGLFCSNRCWQSQPRVKENKKRWRLFNSARAKGYYFNKGKRCIDCDKQVPNKNKFGRCQSCKNRFMTPHFHKIFIDKQSSKYKHLTINLEQEQIILGSVLGDASLVSSKRKICSSIFCRYAETHCMEQKDYLEWKINKLNLPNRYKQYHQAKNASRINYPFMSYSTTSLPQLLPYYKIFYPNGKKTVTMDILNMLNPLGLAVWYMDDGNFESQDIYTNGFSYQEQLIIQKWFKEMWELNVQIKQTSKRKKYHPNHYIHFDSINFKEFIKIINPYIPSCMTYKLSINPNRIIHKQEYNKRYWYRLSNLPKSIKLVFGDLR